MKGPPMDSITRGGKALTFEVPEQPAPKVETHFGFQIFDAVTWAQMAREEAIRLCTRMNALQARVDANPAHPDVPKASQRISQLMNKYLEAQARFLKWEHSIHHIWKHATPAAIEAESADSMLHVLPTDETLPPLWHHPLGAQE